MPALIIGIPACREREWLPNTLASLAEQQDLDFTVWVHVNQPAGASPETTIDNLATLDWLNREAGGYPFVIRVRDGLRDVPHGKGGVGWARRVLFDQIVAESDPEDICISLDADTCADPGYTAAVREALAAFPRAGGLAAPYYHHLPDNQDQAARILRYECYMRYYQLSLARSGSPYAFTALGSALAFRAGAYTRAGGFPLRKAGEDFYFLQQLRKIGPLIRNLTARVYPSARISDRVPFGTGPVMDEELGQQEERFPFYAQSSFGALRETYALFSDLYEKDVVLPIDAFLEERLEGRKPFEKIRRNYKDQARFIHACHVYFDGLRTLQFLRWRHVLSPCQGRQEMEKLCSALGVETLDLDFQMKDIASLNRLRDRLALLSCGPPRIC
jgi:hypothetical protein